MSNFCTNCGASLEEGQTCQCQATEQPENNFTSTPPTQEPVQPQNNQPPVYNQQNFQPSDNSKIYKVLSYIGILWLIGMFAAPEKDNPSVRFHVGQGIMLTIVEVALGIVYGILYGILMAIFAQTATVYGITYTYAISGIGSLLIGLVALVVWAASIALAIMGIMNAVNGKEKPLPIIGKFAFYK